MIGIAVRVVNQTAAVAKATERMAVRNVGKAAASTRKRAIESVTPSNEASPPGTPPHTRLRISRKTGKARPGQIQRAIVYHHDKDANVAVVGPRHSVLGEAGKAHEFGGEYKGGDYPERPFMGPALDKTQERYGNSFAGALGS